MQHKISYKKIARSRVFSGSHNLTTSLKFTPDRPCLHSLRSLLSLQSPP